MPAGIRVVALGAVQRGPELLVEQIEDPQTGEPFYRLLGGGVEFGEHSSDAVVREFHEELGVSFVDPEPVGTFEDVFTHDGATKHELWRVYEGDIEEDWPYEHDRFRFQEPERERPQVAHWLSPEMLRQEETTFYTPEILDALGV